MRRTVMIGTIIKRNGEVIWQYKTPVDRAWHRQALIQQIASNTE